MRLSTMHIPPESRCVCKTQAIRGGDNFRIYLVYLFLDDSLLHFIRTKWVSRSYFSFTDSILRLVCELSLIQLTYSVWSYPK